MGRVFSPVEVALLAQLKSPFDRLRKVNPVVLILGGSPGKAWTAEGGRPYASFVASFTKRCEGCPTRTKVLPSSVRAWCGSPFGLDADCRSEFLAVATVVWHGCGVLVPASEHASFIRSEERRVGEE